MTTYAIVTATGFVGGRQVNDDAPEEDGGPRALTAFVGLAHRAGLTFTGIVRTPALGQVPGSRWLAFTEDAGKRPIEHLVLAWVRVEGE